MASDSDTLIIFEYIDAAGMLHKVDVNHNDVVTGPVKTSDIADTEPPATHNTVTTLKQQCVLFTYSDTYGRQHVVTTLQDVIVTQSVMRVLKSNSLKKPVMHDVLDATALEKAVILSEYRDMYARLCVIDLNYRTYLVSSQN